MNPRNERIKRMMKRAIPDDDAAPVREHPTKRYRFAPDEIIKPHSFGYLLTCCATWCVCRDIFRLAINPEKHEISEASIKSAMARLSLMKEGPLSCENVIKKANNPHQPLASATKMIERMTMAKSYQPTAQATRILVALCECVHEIIVEHCNNPKAPYPSPLIADALAEYRVAFDRCVSDILCKPMYY